MQAKMKYETTRTERERECARASYREVKETSNKNESRKKGHQSAESERGVCICVCLMGIYVSLSLARSPDNREAIRRNVDRKERKEIQSRICCCRE